MTSGSPPPEEKLAFHDSAREAVREALVRLRSPVPAAVDPEESRHRQGRTFGAVNPAVERTIALVDEGDGALRWRDGVGGLFGSTSGDRGVEPSTGPDVLIEIPVEILGPNRIVARLIDWDGQLTPHQGLRRLNESGKLEPIPAVPQAVDLEGKPGGILLFIHGTFSNGENILDQLNTIEADAQFLHWARSRYEHILSFDHPTLSVSPVLNALDLARFFAGVRGPVDVICHSRGGLVARWWLEAFGGSAVGPRRTVFVASPLGGTSLASPARIREAFDLFSTVGSHLKSIGEVASVYLPFMTVAVGLMQVFVAVTGAAAQAPMADLFFCTVPGLGSMSRVGNASELDRLWGGQPQLPEYFAIRSDFRMDPVGWKFWRHFSRGGIAQWGADRVFDQANDLVVDNRSTGEFFPGRGLPPGRIEDITSNGQVHHTNYFLQPRVARALRRFLA